MSTELPQGKRRRRVVWGGRDCGQKHFNLMDYGNVSCPAQSRDLWRTSWAPWTRIDDRSRLCRRPAPIMDEGTRRIHSCRPCRGRPQASMAGMRHASDAWPAAGPGISDSDLGRIGHRFGD